MHSYALRCTQAHFAARPTDKHAAVTSLTTSCVIKEAIKEVIKDAPH